MAARAGMANLIKDLRSLTMTEAGQYTVDGVSWFTDDQLQDQLDALRVVWIGLDLEWVPTRKTGGYDYKVYRIPQQVGGWIEENATDSGWNFYDNEGTAVAVSYTVNYRAGLITFAADTGGKSYWLECRSYNLNKAAANVWRIKAALESRQIDWASDNHDIKAEARYRHCLEMAERFEEKTGLQFVPTITDDWNA